MPLSWPKLFQLATGFGVKSGPFRGMSYITACIGSALWPKLLGTYELELWSAVEEIVAAQCDVIVNAGAAEGYYTVGFALRCPAARVVSFELEPEGRRLQELLAARNGVQGRISAQVACTLDSLNQSLAGAHKPAVVMDVEGAEINLLDVEKCPALRHAFILVELHDRGTMEKELCARFAGTHVIERLESRERSPQDLPPQLRWLHRLGFRGVMETLEEGRGVRMAWLSLKPAGKE